VDILNGAADAKKSAKLAPTKHSAGYNSNQVNPLGQVNLLLGVHAGAGMGSDLFTGETTNGR
jgi:hypothetical protein